MAEALGLPDEYFAGCATDLKAQRDLLAEGLADLGFEVYRPQGTYFVTTDIRPLGARDGAGVLPPPARPGRRGGDPRAVFYDDQDAAAPWSGSPSASAPRC